MVLGGRQQLTTWLMFLLSRLPWANICFTMANLTPGRGGGSRDIIGLSLFSPRLISVDRGPGYHRPLITRDPPTPRPLLSPSPLPSSKSCLFVIWKDKPQLQVSAPHSGWSAKPLLGLLGVRGWGSWRGTRSVHRNRSLCLIGPFSV